jgi:hypothetical protein
MDKGTFVEIFIEPSLAGETFRERGRPFISRRIRPSGLHSSWLIIPEGGLFMMISTPYVG